MIIPKVTVVIATRNRPLPLASLLASLLCQSLEAFNVVIALNGKRSWSTYLDKLVEGLYARGVLVNLQSCLTMTFAELHQQLLALSATEFICRVDDDQVLDPKYLENLLACLEMDSNIGAVGGVILHPSVSELVFAPDEFTHSLRWGRGHGILATLLQLKRHPQMIPLHVPDLYSSFMMRRMAVDRVGGIATCYNACGYREETDLTLRLSFGGFRQLIVPTAVAWHLRCDSGGERRAAHVWERLRAENEKLFQKRLHAWCDDPVSRFSSLWDDNLARTLQVQNVV